MHGSWWSGEFWGSHCVVENIHIVDKPRMREDRRAVQGAGQGDDPPNPSSSPPLPPPPPPGRPSPSPSSSSSSPLLPLLPRRSPARQEVSAFQNEGRGPRVLARRWPGPSLGSRRSQPNCSILYPNLPLIDRPGRECGLFGAISGGMAEHSAARVETLLMPRRGLQLGPASISWNFA